VVGSALLGQAFTGLGYFHPRPSAAGAAASGSMIEIVDDNGEPTGTTKSADPTDLSLVASSASNLGPTNEDFLATVEERVAEYRKLNRLGADVPVPVDAVTASGSGLDPHISVANARLQARRVARIRNLDRTQVLHLIDRSTEGRSLGFLGEKGVNVLRLNLALDKLGR
jgi:K+-transporting ATPase ATPase C chain